MLISGSGCRRRQAPVPGAAASPAVQQNRRKRKQKHAQPARTAHTEGLVAQPLLK